MTLLGRLLDRGDPVEPRTIRDVQGLSAWARGDDFGATTSSVAGVKVTRESALGVSTVWACVSLLSDVAATLPVDATTTDSEGTIDIITRPKWLDHPNAEMDRVQWVFSQCASLLLHGNIFMYTVRDKLGDVVEAWPLDPNYVQVRRELIGNKAVIAYYVMVAKGMMSPVGPFRVEQGPEMFHIPYFMVSSNYPRGLGPIDTARQMFGGAIASQEYGARFFGQGMSAAGVLEAPEKVTIDQAREIKRDFANANGGLKKMHLPPLLTEGMTFKQIQVTPEQAQFLQSRQFSVEEVARWFRVPPPLLGELTKSTSWGTGLEQMSTGFVQYTVRPLLERLEEAWSNWMLWTKPDQRIRFNVEGLLRGDRATRTAYYTAAKNNGWMSSNDVLREEGGKLISPEDGGDDYWRPANMVVAGEEPPPPPDQPDPTIAGDVKLAVQPEPTVVL